MSFKFMRYRVFQMHHGFSYNLLVAGDSNSGWESGPKKRLRLRITRTTM